MLQACLNGGRTRQEHPAVPVTADELAADAAAAVAAGAGALHVHPRDADGRESLADTDVGAALLAIRAAVGVPLGVSTGAWIGGDPVAAVRAWTVLPDFASVNVHEDRAAEVAAALLGLGIGVEAGVWSPGAVALVPDGCLRVLLEVQEGDDPTPLVDAARCLDAPLLLHGEGTGAWSVLDEAMRRGLDTRIGLEDTLVLPDGTPAAGNAELVTAALSGRGSRAARG